MSKTIVVNTSSEWIETFFIIMSLYVLTILTVENDRNSILLIILFSTI